ncbi:MAG TPA: acyltransferase [Steroidobacteraceae bacterium]|nr:acyltransferase [Steroidobacteraceae bacterium]
MNDVPARGSEAAPQLTALNGMRFFAVFHIFLYHLWSIRFESPRLHGPFGNAYANMDSFPAWFNNLIAHGYLSTSFFFLLSGFILAYLYWMPDGALATTRKRFWWQRFTRIYPAHLIAFALTALLTLPRYFLDPAAPPIPLAAASAVATATLTQAWVPPLVPIWSWPTWALSAVVFLYLIMPWLMRVLSGLSRAQQIGLLVASPLISLAPTLVFLQFFPDGAKDSVNWQIFLGSTPLFWVAHFAAGMLMSRIFGISRFETAWREKRKPWVSLGDVALAAVVALSLMEPHDRVWRHILRHGALLPLYMLVLYDLALGRGLVARVFSLPGMNFLGQLSFSIFIWQNLFMALGFAMVLLAPQMTNLSFWFAVIGLLVMSVISTRFIEQPLARRLRAKWGQTPITGNGV